MARWNSCNILHLAPDAKRLWQFDAKGGGFALGREQRVPHAEPLPGKFVAKSWSSLWSPRLNVAWLPPEHVFLRVVELPASNPGELLSMVELQLEKLSPLPTNQVVWTMHPLTVHTRPAVTPAGGEAPAENLQTVVVVIVERKLVEDFLGQLEGHNFLADRLEVPMLDQLAVTEITEDGVWLYPLSLGGQSAALTAWWYGGALRNLSYITLPPEGDRTTEIKNQLSLLTWAGELEGWLNAPPKWHLVADPVNAAEWEQLLHSALNEPVQVSNPPAPAQLAAGTAHRAASSQNPVNLLPPEFTDRYRQQFFDRLWLRGLIATGILYLIGLAVYFSAVTMLSYRTQAVEQQVAAVSNDYTNALQLKARFDVLKERQDLKFAALDCWKLVAEQLPEGLTLQRFSFADGHRLALSGSCTSDQIARVTDPGGFYDGVRKAQADGQPIFSQDPSAGDPLLYRTLGTSGSATWSFALELVHSEATPQ